MDLKSPSPNGVAIEVKSISKRFGALLAVDDVSFKVQGGEIFGLLGPNGAGKSTLIRMLTTLVPPTSGTAIVAGHDIIRDPTAVRCNIGVIPQNMTSDPELTCAENLGIHARLYGITGARRRQRTAELLEAVGLADRANALAATLSGGMRRRLEIARGLVHDPQLLFLDEPTTGLDPVSRISVWEMITHLRAQQGRTLFLTTHYMDEADRLCDRVAIVDRGRIVALDTPVALKASVPGASRIEVQFEPDLPHGIAGLESLPAVKSVRALGSATYRISSDRGPASAQELVEFAREHKLELKSLSVQSTSLDDVFLNYTGHGLAEVADGPVPAGRPKEARRTMKRALALVERDMRKFRRSPALLFASLVLPLVQLVILGNAFGGNIKNVRLGVVNLDRGPQSVDVLERVRAVGANARTFLPTDYADQDVALSDLRKGVLSGVLIIPLHYSRDLLERHQPHLALITDNTDRSVAGAVGSQMSDLVASINAPQVPSREPAQAALDVVEVYPYINYIKYLLPGSMVLAIFVTAMIGGGMLFIDDKSRGLHEGYMVTPITKWELIAGFNLSGVIKAVLAGETVLVLGAVVAEVPNFFQPARLAELTLMVVLTSVALIGMMFFIMARISDPLVPRAIFGVLNTLLFFPSGAVYPIAGFPGWLRWLSVCDPFTYAVHSFRILLLKDAGLGAVTQDIFALVLTSVVVLGGAALLFRRTL